MGDPMKKVRAGVRLKGAVSATAWNTFLDLARRGKMEAHGQGRTAKPPILSPQKGVVLVENQSGADQARFAVLGIDAPVFTPSDSLDAFQNQVALKGVVPDADDHTGRFAILLEPAATYAIVPALVVGLAPVRVDVLNAAHRFADVADGVTANLKSAPSGAAEILWKETGTGLKWALVRVAVGARPACWARLKTEVGGGEYTAIPLEDDAATPTGGVDLVKVREVSGRTGIDADPDTGAVVKVERDFLDDPDEWRFAYGGVLPATARYQVLVANEADLKWRPDWVRVHA
jgi:hypothetical protein